jgi:hypothetical protein
MADATELESRALAAIKRHLSSCLEVKKPAGKGIMEPAYITSRPSSNF